MIREIKKNVDKFKYGEFINNINESDYREFKDVNDAKKWGENHYSKWAKEYKKNMYVAKEVIGDSCFTSVIEYYCGNKFREINQYLRFNRDTESKSGSEMAKILAIMLSMSPRVPDNIIAYRLVCDDFVEKIIENNKKGIPTVEKGFISTSLIKDIINIDEAYANHKNLLKIYIKKDTVGIYVNEIEKREEEELLLMPKGYFRLIKSPYNDGNKKIYECELFYFN